MLGKPTTPFIARSGMHNGHVQTIISTFLPRTSILPRAEERVVAVERGVHVLLHCHWQADRDRAPTVVVVHGLEGSSESQYVIGTANKAWAAAMNVVRMNVRSCGEAEKLSPTLYHSGLSGDVGEVVRTLVEKDGLKHVGLVGYSMGGNLVLKLAGEWGSQAPKEVCAIAAVSPAMDLSPTADALHLWENRMYEVYFLLGLSGRYRRKALQVPGRYDVKRLMRVRSLRDYDDTVVAHHFGFAGAEDYYQRASSGKVLEHIAVKTLVLHALDDPFIRVTTETRQKLVASRVITYVETAHGGHCGFLAEARGYDGRWAERECIAFLREELAQNC